jgi:fatty acid desaturase
MSGEAVSGARGADAELAPSVASTSAAPPTLPRSFYTPSTAGGIAFAATAVAMFVLPALGAAWVVDASWPAAVRAVLVLALALLGQQGLHLLGFVGHEGFHLNLHRNKTVSALLGIGASSMVFSFTQVGVAITHALHHRSTNGPEDPDLPLFSPHQTLWRRLLFGRLSVNRLFLANTIRIAFDRPLSVPIVVPFRPRQLRALARVNLLGSVAFAALYAWVFVVAPWRAFAAIGLPHLLGIALSGLRPYLEHAGTESGPFRDARSYTAPIFTWLFYGNNFHLEHHLYPSVPCYRLAALHRRLAADGYYARTGAFVETTLRGALAHATGRSRYPMPHPPAPTS